MFEALTLEVIPVTDGPLLVVSVNPEVRNVDVVKSDFCVVRPVLFGCVVCDVLVVVLNFVVVVVFTVVGALFVNVVIFVVCVVFVIVVVVVVVIFSVVCSVVEGWASVVAIAVNSLTIARCHGIVILILISYKNLKRSLYDRM